MHLACGVRELKLAELAVFRSCSSLVATIVHSPVSSILLEKRVLVSWEVACFRFSTYSCS